MLDLVAQTSVCWCSGIVATSSCAIFEACRLRFRPILMTTFTAILGAVPLAVGTGVGAELRQPLGISIIGGLVLSQLLTLFTTPVVYLALDRLRPGNAKRNRFAWGTSDMPVPAIGEGAVPHK